MVRSMWKRASGGEGCAAVFEEGQSYEVVAGEGERSFAVGGDADGAALAVPFLVVTWMAFALRLHPLGDLEFVVELKHNLLF